MATNSIKLLTGNSHPELAKLVADRSVSACNGISLNKKKCGQLTIYAEYDLLGLASN